MLRGTFQGRYHRLHPAGEKTEAQKGCPAGSPREEGELAQAESLQHRAPLI